MTDTTVVNDVQAILHERGSRYGSFLMNADISQALKTELKKGRAFNEMPPDMKEALEMICHKMARIVNGDPFYLDSWQDIIGYTTLVVEERLS